MLSSGRKLRLPQPFRVMTSSPFFLRIIERSLVSLTRPQDVISCSCQRWWQKTPTRDLRVCLSRGPFPGPGSVRKAGVDAWRLRLSRADTSTIEPPLRRREHTAERRFHQFPFGQEHRSETRPTPVAGRASLLRSPPEGCLWNGPQRLPLAGSRLASHWRPFSKLPGL